MKKITCLFFAFCFSMCFTVSAEIFSGDCGDLLKWSFNTEDSTLSFVGSGKMSDYNYHKAPWYIYADSIKYLAFPEGLTYVGMNAFASCYVLEDVSFPNSVTSIGPSAFQDCRGLLDVTFPDKLEAIKDHAFFNCKGLTNLTIPNSVLELGTEAFSQCSNLKSISLSNNLKTIGVQCFQNDWALSSIFIPASVIDIEHGPFNACLDLAAINVDEANENYCSVEGILFTKDKTVLIQYPCNKKDRTSYTIPGSVTKVSDNAFSNCKLKFVTLPNTVVEVGNGAFYSYSFESPIYNNLIFAHLPYNYQGGYTIPDGIQYIAGAAFIYCADLTKISIPSTVTTIGRDAFYGCSRLRSLDIPSSVTTIESYAFANCASLTSVTIPENVSHLKTKAFSNCTGLTSVKWEAVDCFMTDYEPEIPFAGSQKNITSFVFGDKVEVLPNKICCGMSSITSITIPQSVNVIEPDAFLGCESLQSIIVESENKDFCDVNGILFNRDTTTLMLFPANHKDTVCYIKEGVERLENKAFMDCKKLILVALPSSLRKIGNNVFQGDSNIVEITSYAIFPPDCNSSNFNGVDYSIPVYVPKNSVDAYKSAYDWNNFPNIQPIKANEIMVSELHAEPTDNSVVFDWPKAEGAVVYSIEIRKNDELICTLEFNNQGQLLNIAFAAPARNDKSRQTPSASQTSTGWQYTISGLDPDTEYTYTVIAKKSDGSEAYNKTVTFTTQQTTTALDQTNEEMKKCENEKIIRNGQILILRGSHTYTLTGQEVR